jgi:hypothetical protein
MRLPLRGFANQTWRRRTFQIARLLMNFSQSPNWGQHPRQRARQSQGALWLGAQNPGALGQSWALRRAFPESAEPSRAASPGSEGRPCSQRADADRGERRAVPSSPYHARAATARACARTRGSLCALSSRALRRARAQIPSERKALRGASTFPRALGVRHDQQCEVRLSPTGSRVEMPLRAFSYCADHPAP